MNPKLSSLASGQPWIPLEKIQAIVQLEPALLIAGLSVGAWLIYKILLGKISPERHRNLVLLFRNLGLHAMFAASFITSFFLIQNFTEGGPALERLLSYLGFFAVLSGAMVFVKVSRILAFEYLFLSHMRAGVPVLLVNLFTLLLSIVIGGWMATEIFSVRLTPLLATSAIFSLVLGLALQDTLGHLFAGVSLQFDKPYEIGDWIEIQANSGPKFVGQVEEISWRATVLIGISDELITVPNRTMAQAMLSNYSMRGKPFIRAQNFRLPFGTDATAVERALIEATLTCPLVRQEISPIVILTETTDSWIVFKLIYFIADYGSQFVAADQVIRAVLERLDREGVELAPNRLAVSRDETTRAAAT